MLKPLTQLNYFFRLATERKLSGSDQLMYLHIFNKFNQAHWTETLRIKDAELKEVMRLYDTNGKPASIETIRRGRQRLKAKGFIEFKSGDGQEPEYKLPCLHPDDTPADTPDNTPADSWASSYLRTREDVQDFKRKNLPVNGAGACELDNLLEYWESELHGGRLTVEHQSELSVWLERYGYDWLRSALKEASDANSNPRGVNPKFLFAVLKRKADVKGGESNARKDPRDHWEFSND